MASNKSANGEGRKFALIHMGTDEVYGLEFVAAELKKQRNADKRAAAAAKREAAAPADTQEAADTLGV